MTIPYGLGLLNSDRTVTMNVKNKADEVNEVTVQLIAEQVLPDYELVETEFYPEQDTALFRLNRCTNNPEYREALASFFQQVDEQDIPTVVLDLRNNIGGDSRVIEEFT
ncbi:MAG: hypothetical protein FH749_10500 [Firmicutes bacterium]|nr:hypothetical protein [Bacillota bacterium]